MIRKQLTVAFATGLLFAFGLGLSGMTRPQKVLDFLDVAGRWDPSLLCVMGAALGVNVILFPRIFQRGRPVFDVRFYVANDRAIAPRLVFGAAMFGVGWGIAGYCPGPSLVSVGTGAPSALVFTSAMALGMTLFAWSDGRAGGLLPDARLAPTRVNRVDSRGPGVGCDAPTENAARPAQNAG